MVSLVLLACFLAQYPTVAIQSSFSGIVDLELAETIGQKLRFNIDTVFDGTGNARDLQASNMQAASFDLEVTLEPQVTVEKFTIMNTAIITRARNAFALVVMIIVSAYTLG